MSNNGKRPYGAKVQFRTRTAAEFGDIENISLSLPTGDAVSIQTTSSAPWEAGKHYVAILEAFPTATAAEAAGRRLAQALLWVAVTNDLPLKLNYQTYEPAAVFERNRPSGLVISGYLTVGRSQQSILDSLQEGLSRLPNPDPKLLLSLEIFCSAPLEGSERARFISLVSALEPLADPRDQSQAEIDFIHRCTRALREEDAIDSEAKTSLEARLLLLRKESISRALRRMTASALPGNEEAVRIVRTAYDLRSQLIHEGLPDDRDVDLAAEARGISDVIRHIYRGMLKRPLAR